MLRKKYSLLAAVAAATAATLTLSACGSSGGGGSTPESNGTSSAGTPVAGGTLKVVQPLEPRSLDPAAINNGGGSNQPLTGNALYGTLLQGDSITSKWTPSMATDLSTSDGGTTWTMKLRSGLVFSDGSPVTAADVVYNWKHIADPTAGSASIQDASGFTSVAVDDQTVKATLKVVNIHFPTVILESDLNWVAKASALQAGTAAFDANPIGAGPFKLESWKRADVMTVVKNPKYWDAPKPYLDKIEFRTIIDTPQRYNTLSTGAADLVYEGSWANVIKAKDNSDLQAVSLPYGGGTGLGLNNTRAPFNDVRARKALAEALNLDLIDTAVNGVSTGQVPKTYFTKDSPFYADIPLTTPNQKDAQDLFNQVAADTGKPVEFTLTGFSVATQPLIDSVQTQLSGYKNVKVNGKIEDIANYGKIVSGRNFDALTTSLTPTRVDLRLNSTSAGNTVGFKDPTMDTALQTISTTTDQAALKKAWTSVQTELASQVPYILYSRLSLSVTANKKVQGISMYGFGSPVTETLWIKQ